MILMVGIAAFLAVLYKLVTTNHWTIGKKLLVCLVSAIVIGLIGKLAIIALAITAPSVGMLIQLPVVCVGLLMAYFFYKKDDVLG